MKIKRRVSWLLILSIFVAILGILALSGSLWYRNMLTAVNPSSQESLRINIKQGMTPDDIATVLEQNKLIRNSMAFSIYVKIHNIGDKFKTGVYSLKYSQTMPEIIERLTSGVSDEIAITFYPGATLETKKSNSDGREVESVLKKAGFSDQAIAKGLAANYNSKILASRPSSHTLEGYIYGETYYVSPDDSVEKILLRAIKHLESIVEKNDLEKKFAARGLTLHQGITLASIVQRESIGCGSGAIKCEDQQKIAGVFYNRLKNNMNLGSDVTYQYVADKYGIERSPLLDSPYNTRIHAGLPPGPIATPSISALNAVAEPIETDNLYFLSGDDDVTYFAKTEGEHQQNIKNHCTKKCLIN